MCHSSENVTATLIVPTIGLELVNDTVTQQRLHTNQIALNETTATTFLILSSSTPSTPVANESITITTPSKTSETLKIQAATKRPPPPNIKVETNSTGINAGRNVSSNMSSDKVNGGGRIGKPKNKQQQMYEQRQQQKKEQQQKPSKVSSWPSKPTGTYLMEGNFSRHIFLCLFVFVVNRCCYQFSLQNCVFAIFRLLLSRSTQPMEIGFTDFAVCLPQLCLFPISILVFPYSSCVR